MKRHFNCPNQFFNGQLFFNTTWGNYSFFSLHSNFFLSIYRQLLSSWIPKRLGIVLVIFSCKNPTSVLGYCCLLVYITKIVLYTIILVKSLFSLSNIQALSKLIDALHMLERQAYRYRMTPPGFNAINMHALCLQVVSVQVH